MNPLKITNKGQAAFAIGLAISALIPLVVILILWFWSRGAIADALETILPGNLGKTTTSLLFGFLALFFLLKFLARWGGG